MRWPWQRDTIPASRVAHSGPATGPAPVGPSPMGWAFLPPLQRTLATGIETITRPTEFAHELPAWRNPSFNAPLTHLVSDAAPSGVIDSGDGAGFPGSSTSPRPELTLLPPPRPAAVQRSTPRAAPARFTTPTDAGLPVMQRSVVPDAPIDEAPAEEVAPASETAETSRPDPVGTEVPVLPVTATAEPATGPVGPSPISGTGPAMPLQRAVSTGTPDVADPAVRAGTRPRLGLGAPLPSVPPTAVSSPVQRTVDTPGSRSVDHSPGQPEPAGQDRPTEIPDDSAGSPAVPLETTAAATPVPLPLQRSADAPADHVERTADPAADPAAEAASELAPGSASGASPEGTAHDSSSPDHATYDAPLLSAQTPLGASDAGPAPDPVGPSPVAASTGAPPLVVARSAQAPGEVSPSPARLDGQPVGAAPTPAGPGPHEATGPGDPGLGDPGLGDSGLGDSDLADAGQATSDAPVTPEHHAQSPMSLPVVSRSVSALPATSTVLRSTPLPLAAGLATSIQRGSVLLGAGTPAASLVVRPTPVLGARTSGRAVPVQRVLTTPSALAIQPTQTPSTMPATADRSPGSAAAPREPFLRRLQRGLFGPDQTAGSGGATGGAGPGASVPDLGSTHGGAPADGIASLGSPDEVLPSEGPLSLPSTASSTPAASTPAASTTSSAVLGAGPVGSPFEVRAADAPSVGLTMPTVSRAATLTDLPGVPTLARATNGLALPAAHLAAEPALPARDLALPTALQRSVTTPDAPLDAPGAAPLPSLALATPPPVVQRENDPSAPGASGDGAQDHVQRATDAGSWGSTEVSLSGPVVQTAVEPPPATGAGGAAATPSQSPEEIEALAQKLLKPMLRRIKGELLLDRERHGLRTDTW